MSIEKQKTIELIKNFGGSENIYNAAGWKKSVRSG